MEPGVMEPGTVEPGTVEVRRVPVDDELLVDGELVVLRGQDVLVLSEVASGALDHLGSEVWTSLASLTDAVEARFGLPDEGAQAVFSLVSDLSDVGLVELRRG
ncbi:hypothetical protein GCM10009798_01070 [Nocardioides panacihumi]|uniref:PqqD family protein n=1 Tax=Nocardioides panacihumi TaxID=400774 RepID=A0ABN2Q794_9ACTN